MRTSHRVRCGLSIATPAATFAHSFRRRMTPDVPDLAGPCCRPCTGLPGGTAGRRIRRRRHVDARAAAADRRAAARGRLCRRSGRTGRPGLGPARCGGARRRRHRRLRLRRRPGPDQPPRRLRRDPVQQHRPAQPDRGRLHRRRPRRRAAGQSGLPGAGHGGFRPGHRPGAGAGARHARPRLLRRGRCGQQAHRRRMRARARDPLQRGQHVQRHRFLQDPPAGAARPAPGLRAAAQHRQLRRRDRQLHVAAPHRRLHPAACLRRPRRQAGRLCARQRALPAPLAPAGGQRRAARRRLRHARRLPGHHLPPPQRRRIRRTGRMDAAGAGAGLRPAAGGD